MPPLAPEGFEHVYHQYTIRIEQRDALQKFLSERKIGSTVYYPYPLHLQPLYASLGHKAGDFPHAERAAQEVLSLPMYPELRKEQIADDTQQVNRVRASENIEEAAGLVARDVHALRDKLAPRNELPGHKKKTKDRGRQPEFAKAGSVRQIEALARGFQRETARKQNASVGPENARKMDSHPEFAAAAQNDESAGQRHEKHQNGNDANRNRGGIAPRRGRPPAAAIAVVAASIAVIASVWR